MKKIALLLLIATNSFAQLGNKKLIEKHIRFLASDEMLGRKTGEQTNLIAARYLAEEFRLNGVETIDTTYLKPVFLQKLSPPTQGHIITKDTSLALNNDFLIMNGGGLVTQNTEVVYMPYAWESPENGYSDFTDVDVKGKIIVATVGFPEAKSAQDIFKASRQKRIFAEKHGAIALIEVFNSPIPWDKLVAYFGKESLDIKSDEASKISHLWLNKAAIKHVNKENTSSLSLNLGENSNMDITSFNVVGIIKGTDPELNQEYIALTAHFDHIGHGAKAGLISKTDTIFNGARDNGIGTAAMLLAAKSFAENPPKRSVLLIGYTGEEVGLLGSTYLADNAPLDLSKVIFNLNTDGAGYNDTSKVTIIGLDRTSAEPLIKEAAEKYGLEAVNDPVPEQGLFDRSDNVSLAAKGIPAPNFAPGFTGFNDEIGKYYHRNVDNPETLDFEYLEKYVNAYILAARLIADSKEAPTWKEGDKYENAFKTLYNK